MAAGRGQTLWLSMLVEAMERFSAPEWRNAPCDAMELAGLRAQLARPAALASHLLNADLGSLATGIDLIRALTRA